jgi:hypothetical protein
MRRNDLAQMTPAELAITEAMGAVEALPPDEAGVVIMNRGLPMACVPAWS